MVINWNRVAFVWSWGKTFSSQGWWALEQVTQEAVYGISFPQDFQLTRQSPEQPGLNSVLTLLWSGDSSRDNPRSFLVSVFQRFWDWAWKNCAWNYNLQCGLTCSFALWKCRHGTCRLQYVVMGEIGLVRKRILFIICWKKVNVMHFLQKQATEIPAPAPMTFNRSWSKSNRKECRKNRFQIFFVKCGCFPAPDSTLNGSPLPPGAHTALLPMQWWKIRDGGGNTLASSWPGPSPLQFSGHSARVQKLEFVFSWSLMSFVSANLENYWMKGHHCFSSNPFCIFF